MYELAGRRAGKCILVWQACLGTLAAESSCRQGLFSVVCLCIYSGLAEVQYSAGYKDGRRVCLFVHFAVVRTVLLPRTYYNTIKARSQQRARLDHCWRTTCCPAIRQWLIDSGQVPVFPLLGTAPLFFHCCLFC